MFLPVQCTTAAEDRTGVACEHFSIAFGLTQALTNGGSIQSHTHTHTNRKKSARPQAAFSRFCCFVKFDMACTIQQDLKRPYQAGFLKESFFEFIALQA